MTQYAYNPYLPEQQTNSLGIAGFICSLLGLLTGGILSPVGLILSLIALGRQPRGMAIAGVVLGLLGTCGGVLLLLVFGAAILAALGIAAIALAYAESEKVEITADMGTIAVAIDQYRKQNNYLPAGLELLSIDESRLIDPWGQRYVYEQKDPQNEFDLVSSGKDKLLGNEDDVRFSQIDKMWGKGGRINIGGRGNKGIVQIDLGGTGVDIEGDDDGGKVRVNVGGRTIEIKGDEEGGSIRSDPSATEPESDDRTEEDLPRPAPDSPSAPDSAPAPESGT